VYFVVPKVQYLLLDVMAKQQLSAGRLPLPTKDSTVAWVGFAPYGMPLFMDSVGVLSGLVDPSVHTHKYVYICIAV
jgi:hypothetical protein